MPRESLTREQVKRAVEELQAQGVPPTRENITEQAATAPHGVDVKGERASEQLIRGGPNSEIARRKQREADEARQKGPSADMLRKFREKYK